MKSNMTYGPRKFADHNTPPQARAVLSMCQRLLGSNLVGVYLHGSFVASGLRPLSDLDFLVVSAHPLSAFCRSQFLRRLLSLSARQPSGPNSPRCLDIFTMTTGELRKPSYPAKSEFIYGEWLRKGFEGGDALVPFVDPVVTLMIAQARPEAISLYGPPLHDLVPRLPRSHVAKALADSLQPLLDNLKGDERNVLLTLARMWRTASERDFIAKDAAAFWAADRLPPPTARILRQCGLAYQGRYIDDWQSQRADAEQAAVILKGLILASLDT